MEHYAKFLNDAGFNSGINPKDKMPSLPLMLDFT